MTLHGMMLLTKKQCNAPNDASQSDRSFPSADPPQRTRRGKVRVRFPGASLTPSLVCVCLRLKSLFSGIQPGKDLGHFILGSFGDQGHSLLAEKHKFPGASGQDLPLTVE